MEKEKPKSEYPKKVVKEVTKLGKPVQLSKTVVSEADEANFTRPRGPRRSSKGMQRQARKRYFRSLRMRGWPQGSSRLGNF